MATLTVVNNYEMLAQGVLYTGKQGAAASDFAEGYDITVSGYALAFSNTLATGSARTIFDDDNQFPADWEFLHIWADTAFYLQLIGATGNVIIPVAALRPFTWSGDSILVAANTTPMSGAAPVVEDIDSIVIQNNSGGAMNYRGVIIV